jgi:hypothetical protein
VTAALTLAAQPGAEALRIQIVEGDGLVYATGSRSARGVTVQVLAADGRPVEGALVSFLLPDRGPSGVFASGSRTGIATTGADGLASAWGMRWNRAAGVVAIRITAARGPARGSAECRVTLSDAPEARGGGRVSGGGRKWLWVALAVAGAAGGIAARGLRSTSAPSASAPPAPPVIGPPVVTIGRP